MSEDNISVIEQGSAEAQKLAKAMSSPTAAMLYNKLADGPSSTTALAESTGLPLTTVKYHLENLLDAGVIEVVGQKWSEKGRAMKIYGVTDRVVVFAPPQSKKAGSILKKYGVVTAAVGIGCAFAAIIPRTILERMQSGSQTAQPKMAMVSGVAENGPVVTDAANNMVMTYAAAGNAAPAPALAAEPIGDAVLLVIQNCALCVFLSAVIVLGALMIFELVKNRRTKGKRAEAAE